jgi:DNA-3-methyladenine glycosylase
MEFLGREFFQRDPLACARELVGCELVVNGCGGIVVETEAYAARNDEACHTFSRPSSRAFVAERPAGAAYVYLNYGMHWLLNFLVKGGAEDGFVLVRALEPTLGIEAMGARRGTGVREKMCSGPGKLTRALGIAGELHGCDFFSLDGAALRRPEKPASVLAGPRIGIRHAADLPWRFVLAGSRFLSAPLGGGVRGGGSVRR